MKWKPRQRQAKGWRSAARTLLWGTKALFTPVALGFLAYFAWRSRDLLTAVLSGASVPHMLLAVIVWCIGHLLAPLFAVLVLRGCGAKVTWRAAFATHASRLPARYVPGGIWHTVGRVMDYHDLGIRPRHLTAFVLLENGLVASVTLSLGGAIVFASRGADSIGLIAGLCAMASIAALPVLWLVSNRHVLGPAESYSLADFARTTVFVLLFWLVAASAFVLYVTAFPATTEHLSWMEVAGVYLFSWGVGFVSVFAPQGIGVFEVVASELLKGPLDLTSLAVLIGGFRIIMLAADLAVWGLYHAYRVRRAENSDSKSA